VFLGLAVVAAVIMRFTVFGRIIYALGGSRETSILAGIRVNLVVFVVYAASGALAAFAGVVTASQILAGSAGVGSTTALTSVAAAAAVRPGPVPGRHRRPAEVRQRLRAELTCATA
jgi:ribose transport system permease protein